MIDILRNRRSVRKFTDNKIETEKINILQEALLLSPTSRNIDPCEFIMVRDKITLEKLSKLKPHGAAFIKECDTAFVICGDTAKSDVCVTDCSIASIILQLEAESIGLKSCWAQVNKRFHNEEMYAEQYVRELLHIPENFTVVSVIAVGYPAETRPPKTSDSLKKEKIHNERF
ncbi:nitroreductase [Denitrovibrio acetiphilus DSM 12809]|uniref:Nitroreductase n=1 Tax=Denitrovibrio acetiphilus (strain DSM 12809 / NBRC 114555 / N2460) TaxID=522772 RepID=D4H2B0_DENA2|nr:nitroreductase family protein [Denitrovibrio acetiphilus]ADD68901.1 nitroreductase [Denitrovibrio acetiphilus DSM 12809]